MVSVGVILGLGNIRAILGLYGDTGKDNGN